MFCSTYITGPFEYGRVHDFSSPSEIIDIEDEAYNSFDGLEVGDVVGAWWKHYNAEVCAVYLFKDLGSTKSASICSGACVVMSIY